MRASDVAVGDRVRVTRGRYLNSKHGGRAAGQRELATVVQVWRKDRQALIRLADSEATHVVSTSDLHRVEAS